MQTELEPLSRRYDVVVANPPYMGSSNMNSWLSGWTKKRYKEVCKDLCTCFIKRGFGLSDDRGYEALITSDTCMYISSFEKMRREIIERTSIVCFIDTRGTNAHPDVFDANAGWVLWNHPCANIKGSYFKLNHPIPEKGQRLLEALANPDCGWFYRADASEFETIPGSPIAYWATQSTITSFSQNRSLSSIAKPRQGLATSDNNRFLKYWWEISNAKFGVGFSGRDEAASSKKKWFPCNKGGSFRKWYGNNEYVVNWENDGKEMLEYAASLYGSPTRTVKNMALYFQEGITWSSISSGALSMRFSPKGYIFETKGSMCFAENHEMLLYLLGFANTSVVKSLMKILSPTLDFHEGPMGNLPIVETDAKTVADRVEVILPIAIDDWDSFEESWDFRRHPLI